MKNLCPKIELMDCMRLLHDGPQSFRLSWCWYPSAQAVTPRTKKKVSQLPMSRYGPGTRRPIGALQRRSPNPERRMSGCRWCQLGYSSTRGTFARPDTHRPRGDNNRATRNNNRETPSPLTNTFHSHSRQKASREGLPTGATILSVHVDDMVERTKSLATMWARHRKNIDLGGRTPPIDQANLGCTPRAATIDEGSIERKTDLFHVMTTSQRG